MQNEMFTKKHAMWAGAGLLGALTYVFFPYPICVGVGAILGAMLIDADYSLPGPRSLADIYPQVSTTEENV